MSRSHRYNPYIKYSDSNKKDKTSANRKFRRIAKQLLQYTEIIPVSIREVSNVWSFSSDGLAYFMKASLSKKEDDVDFIKRILRK